MLSFPRRFRRHVGLEAISTGRVTDPLSRPTEVP